MNPDCPDTRCNTSTNNTDCFYMLDFHHKEEYNIRKEKYTKEAEFIKSLSDLITKFSDAVNDIQTFDASAWKAKTKVYTSYREHTPSSLASSGNVSKFLKELSDCIVLCANCHNVWHHDPKLIPKIDTSCNLKARFLNFIHEHTADPDFPITSSQYDQWVKYNV